MRKLLSLLFPGLVLVAACSSTQRHAALACDEAAVAASAPQIEAALAAHDKAKLVALATELGVELFVCGVTAATAKAPVVETGSGSGSAK